MAGYEIQGELGRGGMGVVYKALQVKANRQVALKMILGGGHPGAEGLARFLTEAQAIAALQHPNIVQVFEVGESQGLPFFSLEFCNGGSLDRRLRGTPLPPTEAAGLVETLAWAMHAAHRAGVIHRDLKPANVLLTGGVAATGTILSVATPQLEHAQKRLGGLVPKITDFGLAKKLDDDSGRTQQGVIMGTPSYMAPEQAKGKTRELGPPCDIYALGAILYECLTGRPPFRAATLLDTIQQVIHDEPVPPSQVQSKTPQDLQTICLKCLHKEPGKRYDSAASLAEDLSRYRRGEPVSARPVGRLERGWRWCKRNPVVASLLATVLLVFATGTTVSTLLYFLAERRADEAVEQKERAMEKEAEAILARNDLEKTNDQLLSSVARNLLRPLAVRQGERVRPTGSERRDPAAISPPERQALWELASTRVSALRPRFMEVALASDVSRRQLNFRAAAALQSAMGLDRSLREEVEKMLAEPLLSRASTLEQQLYAVDCLTHLGGLRPELLGKMSAPLIQAIREQKDRDFLPDFSQTLVVIALRLEANEAADMLLTGIHSLTSRGRNVDALNLLVEALVTVTDRMRPLDAVGRLLQVPHTSLPQHDVETLAAGLRKSASLLNPDEAREVSARLIQDMSNATRFRTMNLLTDILSVVLSRLTLEDATLSGLRASEVVLNTFANSQDDPRDLGGWYRLLRKLAVHMSPADAKRICKRAIGVLAVAMRLPNGEVLDSQMATTLAILAGFIEPGEATTLLTDTLKKSGEKHYATVILTDGILQASSRLPSPEATRACQRAADVLTESLSRPMDSRRMVNLVSSLEKVLPWLDSQGLVKCAQTVTQTVRGQTNEAVLEAISKALLALIPKLDAGATENITIALQEKMRATTEPNLLRHLLGPLAVSTSRLRSDRAVALSAEVTAHLVQLMSKSKSAQTVRTLAEGLSQLAPQLPRESAAESLPSLIQAMNDCKDLFLHEYLTSGVLTLALRLEVRDAALRLVQFLGTVGEYASLTLLAEGLAGIANDLGPADVKAVADSLSANLLRSTKGYNKGFLAQGLAATLGQLERGHASSLSRDATSHLIQAINQSKGSFERQVMGRGLAALLIRTEPEEAVARLTQSIREVVQRDRYDEDTLNILIEALSRIAIRLNPQQAHRAAECLLQCVIRANRFLTRSKAPECLSLLATRLGPQTAAQVCGEVVLALGRELINTREAHMPSLLFRIQAVVPFLESQHAEEAATLLCKGLNRYTDLDEFRHVVEGLALLGERLGLEVAALVARDVIEAMACKANWGPKTVNALALILAREEPLARQRSIVVTLGGLAGAPSPLRPLPLFLPACKPLPPPLPPQALVDLLKNPFCFGESRRVVLNQLSRHYQRAFVDQWQFVDFVHQNGVGLDFSTPPSLPERLADRK